MGSESTANQMSIYLETTKNQLSNMITNPDESKS